MPSLRFLRETEVYPVRYSGQGFLFSVESKRKDIEMEIHLVEKLNNFVRPKENLWESGWWALDESEAAKLV